MNSYASKIIGDATALGDNVAPSDMSSLNPSQLNNSNGRSFFVEIGADISADLPPLSGDPAAGGGLQTGSSFQQKPLAPTYVINLASISEQVGLIDPSKFFISWKVALDSAYVKRNTELAPDNAAHPSNPNREALSKNVDPVYLCSDQLQQACGNSRYFTRFGQAEITENLYTTAFARFNRLLPTTISFQFPCALDIIPDNRIRYYANSPRIATTRDLSTGTPMAAPYYENQFVSRFNIRFIITPEISLNANPIYGRVRSAMQGAHTLGTSVGVVQPSGTSSGASVPEDAVGIDRVAERERREIDQVERQKQEHLQTATENVEKLRAISQHQAVAEYAKSRGGAGQQVLELIGSAANAASSALYMYGQAQLIGQAARGSGRLPVDTDIPIEGMDGPIRVKEFFPELPSVPDRPIQIRQNDIGDPTTLPRPPGYVRSATSSLSGFTMPSSLAASSVTASTAPSPFPSTLGIPTTSVGVSSSDRGSLTASTVSRPASVVTPGGGGIDQTLSNLLAAQGVSVDDLMDSVSTRGSMTGGSSTNGDGAPSFFDDDFPQAAKTRVEQTTPDFSARGSTQPGGFLKQILRPSFTNLGPAPPTTQSARSSFDPIPTEAGIGAGGDGGGAAGAAQTRLTLNPFTGSGIRTEGVDARTVARENMKARQFWDIIEGNETLPSIKIPFSITAVQRDFAQSVRNEIEKIARGPIDTQKMAEAISEYNARSQGYVPTKASIGYISQAIARNYQKRL